MTIIIKIAAFAALSLAAVFACSFNGERDDD